MRFFEPYIAFFLFAPPPGFSFFVTDNSHNFGTRFQPLRIVVGQIFVFCRPQTGGKVFFFKPTEGIT